MKKGFVITDGSEFSVNDLIHFKETGRFVTRAGHLGNHYLSNLLLFACGVPCHIFDRNLMERDRNFYPGHIIIGGDKVAIAEKKDVLVPFGKFSERNSTSVKKFILGKNNPAQVHFDSMKKLFADVWTESEFFHANAQYVEQLVNVMVEVAPHLFRRRVDSQGETFVSDFSSSMTGKEVLSLNRAACLALTQSRVEFSEGIIPKIEAAIILTTLLGVKKHGCNIAYELSGPDMVRYALKESFKEEVGNIYRQMRKKISDLPETIELVVVPSFYFRFGSLESEKNEMDCLWDSLKEFYVVNASKKKKLKDFSSNGASMMEINSERQKSIIEFDSALDGSAEKIFSGNVSKRMEFSCNDFSRKVVLKDNFFSQYDLLASGEKLYIPEEVRGKSMRELEEYYRIMRIAKQRLK